MKLEEYSQSVMRKAVELIKSHQVIVEYPLTDKEILTESKLWRFIILYGKDNDRKGCYYVDKDGRHGNQVFHHMEKGHWTCSCMHYAMSANEGCKHICAARIIQQKRIKDAQERLKKEGLNEAT